MSPPLPAALEDRAAAVEAACIACDRCTRDCGFLQRHGNPGALAARLRGPDGPDPSLAFGCSLCGLCDAVCPQQIPIRGFLLDLRRASVARDRRVLRPYRALRTYEVLGGAWPFRRHAVPAGCDTVLFPGCALPGTRPGPLWALYRQLREKIPRLGLVLDCCRKPSHDLGDAERFRDGFAALRRRLLSRGVRRVLVACPSCLRVFREYGAPLEATTVWEVLAGAETPPGPAAGGTVVIHDSCVTRREAGLHDAVRTLVRGAGLDPVELPHCRGKTVCCGEGGAVGVRDPGLAGAWTERRAEESAGRPVLTYCAGCTEYLGRRGPALHLLDLLFAGRETGGTRPTGTLHRYRNRLILARRVRRELG